MKKIKRIINNALKSFNLYGIDYIIKKEEEFKESYTAKIQFNGPTYSGRPDSTNSIQIDVGFRGGTVMDPSWVQVKKDGHSITVDPGTYYENVMVDKQLSIRSGSGNPVDTIVTAVDPDSHVFNVTVGHVDISGLTVTRAKRSYKAGIYLGSGVDRCNISNNVLSNNYNGIYLDSSNNNMLSNNMVKSNNFNGITLESSSSNTLKDNIATENFENGFNLLYSNSNTLTDNDASGNSFSGIFLGYSNGNIIINNSANLNYGGGVYLLTACNNTLMNNSVCLNYYGIEILSSNTNMVINNNASGNYFLGIRLCDSNNNTIMNNSANSNDYFGIYVLLSNNNTVTSNSANSNNYYGISLEYYSNNNLVYNNYFNNMYNAYDDGINIWNTTKATRTNIAGGPYLGGNYWSDYSGNDMDGDGLGDTFIPYNSTGGIINGGDYLPLVHVESAIEINIYVNTTGWWRKGGIFNTSLTPIQAGVDNAIKGEHVFVYNGTYTENVNINKQITLEGEGPDKVNVIAKSIYHVFTVSADRVNISGFNIIGKKKDSDTFYPGNDGIVVLNDHGSYIDHCNISNNNISYNWNGIQLWTSGNNTLMNNNVSDNMNGVLLRSSSNNIIYNNYFNNIMNNVIGHRDNIWNSTKTAGTNIVGGPYLGGNYWSDYIGIDTDEDGIGDTDLPYNKRISSGGDYLPLIPEE